jgi:hypothetical protein
VCDEREGDEEWLGEERLVVGACEEEVAVRLPNGACKKWDDSDVRNVEGCEDCKSVRGVSLGSCYCAVLDFEVFGGLLAGAR